MKFLANENFPYPSIKILRDNDLEVFSIGEESGGISDIEVLNRAVIEDLIILTFDRDYGELLFKYRLDPPPAVVYFRLPLEITFQEYCFQKSTQFWVDFSFYAL